MNELERKAFFKKTFDTVAEGYDNSALRFFTESAGHVPTCLGLKGDEQVLDVATGTGNVALTLAGHLPAGHVTGIDFSAGMLARAAQKKEAQGIANATFVEMDMQQITLPDGHFDAAVSAFSIFFVEDMARQLDHIAAKVKSGGKVMVTSFAEESFSPLVGKFMARLEEFGVEPPPMTWKRIASEDKCISLLKAAGLEKADSFVKDHGYYLQNGEEWWYLVCNGGFRGLVEQLAPEDLGRFKNEHLAEIEELATGDGIWLEMKILYSIGCKA
ncbi:MAG: class I SAM-dependent methyltransferase [Proteobacteria bacterium]|nr:class I SAM-dependent methyltransferase [Pseudomonadota bacterium]MBU1717111.1 class I SAM-dependent methyltransferase [Pseudomonadota bacterium]